MIDFQAGHVSRQSDIDMFVSRIDGASINGTYMLLSQVYDLIGCFSKDGKTSEAQIVLGLLVSRDGYPLSYSIFNGSQYEGYTMIPIIDDFVRRFDLKDFVVVADSGLMNARNVRLLRSAGYKPMTQRTGRRE